MPSFRKLASGGHREVWAFAIALAILAAVPSLGAPNRIIQLAVVAVIWGIVAYGLYVSFGLFGQMTMAIAAVWGVSCFAVALASIHWGWGFWACVPLGIVAGGVAGFVFGLPSLRTHGHYFIVVTFAVAQLAVITGDNWKLVSNTHLGLIVPKYVQLGSINFVNRAHMLYLGIAFAAVVFVVTWLFQHSRYGKAAIAVRENDVLAASLGINVSLYKLAGLALGGAITGCAGAFQVYYLHSVQVDSFLLTQGIVVVEILVLGGGRNIAGPLIGAAFVWLGPELVGLKAVQGQILFGVVLAVIICTFPEGIGGAAGGLWTARWRLRTLGQRGVPQRQDGDPGVEPAVDAERLR